MLPHSVEGLEEYVRLSEAIAGWTRGNEARELARICFSLPADAHIVEIGSFLGSGTILLAGARRLRGSGLVHCVDPFDCTGDAFSVPHYRRILAECGGETLRGLFERNIRAAGLEQWVRIYQGRAEEVACNWAIPVDLLFLDGDQSRAGARSAYDNWARLPKVGGVVALHNSAPDNPNEGHDGSRILVEEEMKPPAFRDIRLVDSTTFATKSEV
jgi:MMP 1-O-methyltransferase